MAGQILRSQIERKRLFDALLQGQKLKVEEKLTYKAQLKGIELIKVDPAYTSSYCHKECECGAYDRDYNASVNIGIKALMVCYAKARGYRQRAIPGRVPFRQGMAGWKVLLTVLTLTKLYAWLQVVHTSYLKAQSLSSWIGLDKYD